jgi:hypothetical protein
MGISMMHDGRRLEGDDLEAGDKLEVLDVECGYVKSEMQGRGSDDEILEGDGDAESGLLALDFPRKPRDLQRDGMHDKVLTGSLGEDAPPFSLVFGLGAIDAMGLLDDGDCGEGNIDLAIRDAHLTEDVFHGLATRFGCDEDACVED